MELTHLDINPVDYKVTQIGTEDRYNLLITSDIVEFRFETQITEPSEVYPHLIKCAEKITKMYLTGYLKRRINAYLRGGGSRYKLKRLQNYFHHVTTTKRNKADFLYMVSRPKWIKVLKNTFKTKDSETDRDKVQALMEMCERRGIRKIKK